MSTFVFAIVVDAVAALNRGSTSVRLSTVSAMTEMAIVAIPKGGGLSPMHNKAQNPTDLLSALFVCWFAWRLIVRRVRWQRSKKLSPPNNNDDDDDDHDDDDTIPTVVDLIGINVVVAWRYRSSSSSCFRGAE